MGTAPLSTLLIGAIRSRIRSTSQKYGGRRGAFILDRSRISRRREVRLVSLGENGTHVLFGSKWGPDASLDLESKDSALAWLSDYVHTYPVHS